MKIQEFKMRVTPKQNKIVQETIFSDKYDCQWNAFVVDKTISQTSAPYLYLENGRLLYGVRHDMFLSENKKELSFEEFKQRYIDKDFVLPEKWCIRLATFDTTEAVNSIGLWEYGKLFWEDSPDYKDRYISHDGKYLRKSDISAYTEITLEQFKKYVLKQDDMKEKKIIGYKLKDEFKDNIPVHKAAISIEGCNCFGLKSIHSRTAIPFSQGYNHERSLKKLTDAGVLDLWFEPVYEEEKELPIINGYAGKLIKKAGWGDGILEYGCAKLPTKLIHAINDINTHEKQCSDFNRRVISITLDSGVKINLEQINQIIDYLTK